MRERDVGGLRCGQVLEALSDYLDDELAPATRAAVEAHVRACPECTRFGARLASVIAAVRAVPADDVAPAVAAALDARLAKAAG